MKQSQLLSLLNNKSIYKHKVENITFRETATAFIILTGEFAYKIKKDITLPGLDYSSISKRKAALEAELSRNKLFAPEIYLEVIPITYDKYVSLETPYSKISNIIEYTIKMHQFRESMTWNNLIKKEAISSQDIYRLAKRFITTHNKIEVIRGDTNFSNYNNFRKLLLGNLDELQRIKQGSFIDNSTVKLISSILDKMRTGLIARKEEGFIRECHSDAHLANICNFNNGVYLFDSIDISPDKYQVDVFNDLSFTLMDLESYGRNDLSKKLEVDYKNLSGYKIKREILTTYKLFRALIRAKFSLYEGRQKDYRRYIKLAESYFNEIV